ncbi:Tannase/feruloyl esterase [Leptodontidium sp. MPI-SDFR-AT-0119]|nr:Tannase/feruloyl esterase [Leptodontidium sp. MPI-SDFR-AT-0119]
MGPAPALFSSGSFQSPLATDAMCNPAALTLPAMSGIQVLSISANKRENYTFFLNPLLGVPQAPVPDLNFCNVTVTYTHPGWNDLINVVTYLPTENKWNGVFLGIGGGGYITGGEEAAQFIMVPSLSQNYAVSTTDGGHTQSVEESIGYTNSWALSSPGNVNWPLLVDFAHVGLHDMATIGKAVTEAFYESPPKYSYFVGGSTGGRQGHMLAQRYPKDFDGLLAFAPAIHWSKFIFTNIYPAFVMESMKVYPRPCEMRAIQKAALSACDDLDGVADGIISRPGLCRFDPHTLVGKSFECDGAKTTFSSAGANVAEAAWNGPRSATGEFQWYGFTYDADISMPVIGVASTECNADGLCKAVPFPLSDVWARYWVKKDPDFDMKSITHEEWDELFHASVSEYESVIGTSDPDLSAFRRAGGKMINWHGMADQAIPVNGSVDYYERVLKKDPKAQDFYRLFLAPGVSHSLDSGVAPQIPDMIKIIRDWVENGKAPETLRAIGAIPNGKRQERDICMYPRVQHYVGGDASKPGAFTCV